MADDEYASARKLVQRAAEREGDLLMLGRRGNADDEAADETPSFAAASSLKKDHENRPFWTCPDGSIFLEANHVLYAEAYEFVVAIAEPVSRPKEGVQQYQLTPYSLYAAAATNMETEKDIIKVLNIFSKNELPPEIATFIRACTEKYGKAKLVLRNNKYYVESIFPTVLQELLKDPTIGEARVKEHDENHEEMVNNNQQLEADVERRSGNNDLDYGCDDDDLLWLMRKLDEDYSDDDEDDSGDGANKKKSAPKVVSFQVASEHVANVRRQAMELDYPLMEEYDYKNDPGTPSITPPMVLKPTTEVRPYQATALKKMFGNRRVRSGIIVLPCGAGKTLTGVVAAQTIQKSVICVCTNTTSVLQWRDQFKMWTTIADESIRVLTADSKDPLPAPDCACVLITTYAMLCHSGKRTEKAQDIRNAIAQRQWGLLIMDEVQVAVAAKFRTVISLVKAHCRLGLTATLVREDDLIRDLNFLIGPKIYEANWQDLTAEQFLAEVECVEVQCPMTEAFLEEYRNPSNSQLMKQLMYVTNPNKLRTVEYLVRVHEKRGDKIIIFADQVFAVDLCAKMLMRPMIHGATKQWERQRILDTFRLPSDHNDSIQTICLSRVGDAAIDLPGASVIIQVSSHGKARQQETQRLGRILRPKSRQSSSRAYFYTLVSTDTQEMIDSAERRQYLIDQGYTFMMQTSLWELARADAVEKGDYTYATQVDEYNLLQEVLSGESVCSKQQRAEDNGIRKINDAVLYTAAPEEDDAISTTIMQNAGRGIEQMSLLTEESVQHESNKKVTAKPGGTSQKQVTVRIRMAGGKRQRSKG